MAWIRLVRTRGAVCAAAAVGIAGLGGVAVAASPTVGTTINVTSTADGFVVNHNCSLREAVMAANTDTKVDACPAGHGVDTIKVPAGAYRLTLGTINVSSTVAIVGTGANTLIGGLPSSNTRAIAFRVTGSLTASYLTVHDTLEGFRIDGGGKLFITNSTIRNNYNTAASGAGGIDNSGSLQIATTSIINNQGPQAGGIANNASAVAVNVTISGNYAALEDSGSSDNGSGGISNEGTLIGRNLTITNNTYASSYPSSTSGGGIESGGELPATAKLANSIIAGNKNTNASSPAPDCSGKITSLGYNLIQSTAHCVITGTLTGNMSGTSPKLGALAKNGGPTLTQMPQVGSPVIDKGNPAKPGTSVALCPLADQRNIARPRDGNGDKVARCDIGAVEK